MNMKETRDYLKSIGLPKSMIDIYWQTLFWNFDMFSVVMTIL